jgi:DNA invertase Pin-like site-specific DNA recombinase
MARNLDHLREIVKTLTEKGVVVEFVKEGLVFSKDDQSPMSRLILSIIGAIAEFEHALIRERQREGIALAKKRGIFGGRPKILSKVEIDHLKELVSSGIPKTKAAKQLGISRESVYAYLK